MNTKGIPLETGQKNPTDFDVLPALLVINLERSKSRWKSVSQSLESSGIKNFTRINAVDAWALSKDQIDSAYDAEMNREHYFSPLIPGEIACFLSHREAWRMLIKENLDGAFIFEDDVIIRPGAVQLMRDTANYANSAEPLFVKIFTKRGASGNATQISEHTKLLEPILPPLGNQGAYVNRAAAEILLKYSHKFYEPVDVFLQKTWAHGVKIQVLVPNAIDEVSNHLGGTTLSSGRIKISSRIRREIKRPIFRVSMYLRAFWEKAIRT